MSKLSLPQVNDPIPPYGIPKLRWEQPVVSDANFHSLAVSSWVAVYVPLSHKWVRNT